MQRPPFSLRTCQIRRENWARTWKLDRLDHQSPGLGSLFGADFFADGSSLESDGCIAGYLSDGINVPKHQAPVVSFGQSP